MQRAVLMARNRLLADLSEEAARLGWSAPLGVDHVEYVCRAVRGMRTFADCREIPPWLGHAWAQEYRDLKERTDWQPLVLPLGPVLVTEIALAATVVWAAQVSLLAVGRRRTGRAVKLVNSCRRVQLAAARAGCGPGRTRDASGGDDERTRPLPLLARERELEGEQAWSLFWGYSYPEVSRAPGRASREAASEGWDE